jgi:DMSO/TMAO reductase YedYZ molybdopterin-dependent catalytic subunit
MKHDLDRRRFLCGLGLASLPWFGRTKLWAGDKSGAAPQLITRQSNPENLEFPFWSLNSFITPNNLSYVRSHFPTPHLDPVSWHLEIAGAVERSMKLTLDEVRRLPSVTRALTLECAGNARTFLTPKPKGVQWDLGAVSTAEWTGTPLAAVLEKVGVRPEAVEVVLEGADRGQPASELRPRGEIAFARSLPLPKARQPEVLLAWAMNGKELPSAHGFPLRAVVGGWYGMASVKWLARVVVVEKPFHGYWQTVDYSTWARVAGEPTMEAITEMQVKAEIACPAAGQVLPAGADYRVHGAAWTGEAEVAKVEVSTDGGRVWEEVALVGKAIPFAWRLWEYTWRKPAEGKYTLLARATDTRNRVQPRERDPGRGSYVISHVLPVPVEVRAG